jgi:hypothetical protein
MLQQKTLRLQSVPRSMDVPIASRIDLRSITTGFYSTPLVG